MTWTGKQPSVKITWNSPNINSFSAGTFFGGFALFQLLYLDASSCLPYLVRQIEQLTRCEPITEDEVKRLCLKAREILVEEANVQVVDSPVTVRMAPSWNRGTSYRPIYCLLSDSLLRYAAISTDNSLI